MPLHIGPSAYEEIRGPYSIHVLRPLQEPDCTFLLLGEEHTSENWEPCDGKPHCANVQLEFVESLDTLAKQHTVEIFLESFFEIERHMRPDPPDASELVYMDYKVKKLKSVTHLPKEQKINAFTTRIHNGSPMLEMAELYKFCFLPSTRTTSRCSFPHLKWNYADARNQEKLSYSGLTKGSTLYSDIVRTLHQYRRGSASGQKTFLITTDLDYEDAYDWEDKFSEGITEPLMNRLCNRANAWLRHTGYYKRFHAPPSQLFYVLLQRLRTILADPKDDTFIDKLIMESGDNILYEQYKSLPPELRTVLTHRSFVKMQRFYKNRFPDNQEETDYAIRLIDILMEYCSIMDDPAQHGRRVELCGVLTTMDYEDDKLSFITNVFMYYTALTLDIYFILRSYNRAKTSKVVVAFFGSAHIDSIVHYLVDIVKTHRIEFHNEGLGVVHIEPDVHLLPVAGLAIKGKQKGKTKKVKNRTQMKKRKGTRKRVM